MGVQEVTGFGNTYRVHGTIKYIERPMSVRTRLQNIFKCLLLSQILAFCRSRNVSVQLKGGGRICKACSSVQRMDVVEVKAAKLHGIMFPSMWLCSSPVGS